MLMDPLLVKSSAEGVASEATFTVTRSSAEVEFEQFELYAPAERILHVFNAETKLLF